jgi:cAMP phosphodiesterase
VSVRGFPISHGTNHNGLYTSTAFFFREDHTQQEFLFFGDVEPDSLSSKPRIIDVWRVAAERIHSSLLSSIFLECSWPKDRDDALLYGHLSPKHVVDELVKLAREIDALRRTNSIPDSAACPPPNKKQRLDPNLTNGVLKGVLAGVKVYIMHCKDSLDSSSAKPMREVIVEQIRELLEEKELGVEVIAVRQGMSLRMNCRSPYCMFLQS